MENIESQVENGVDLNTDDPLALLQDPNALSRINKELKKHETEDKDIAVKNKAENNKPAKEVDKKENLLDLVKTPKPSDSENNKVDTDEKESLKLDLLKTKDSWHQQNKKLIKTQKATESMITALVQAGKISEEESGSLFSALEEVLTEESGEIESKSPYASFKDGLDVELTNYKKYNKNPEVEKYYDSFFAHLGGQSKKDLEDVFEYLSSTEKHVALDNILTTGEQLYNSLYKGVEESGSMLNYVNSIHKDRLKLKEDYKKLEEKFKKLKKELDDTTGRSYNKTTLNYSQKESLEDDLASADINQLLNMLSS